MQEEVFTPPRGGGRQVPEPQGVQSEARAVPKTVPVDTVRNSGKGQRNFRSLIEMLVNTVSHMQRDLAILTGDSGSPAGGTHDNGSAAVRRNY